MGFLLKRYLPVWFYIGVSGVIFTFVSLFYPFKEINVWATPIFWTSYILLLDGIMYSVKGESFIISYHILIVAIISVIVWWFFEWMNIFLSNWHYINVVENIYIRYIGYVWAFATIFPGILLTYGILLILFKEIRIEWHSIKFKNYQLVIIMIIGFIFLMLPIISFSLRFADRAADKDLFIFLKFLEKEDLSTYMAAFTWLSLFLILDPINYSMKRPSILGYLEKGNYKTIVLLSLSGLICGILWEFVNFFAHTKWYYTVPILPHIKIFEMPILGYLGFIPFAWEIYSATSFMFKPVIEKIQKNLLPS